MSCLMGIDVGTTGVKVLLIDETGNVLESATEEYSLSTPNPNWAEQNPEDWWEGTAKAVRSVLGRAKARVEGIGLSGQMHGAVFIDREGNVLRPCIMWCDQRTAAWSPPPPATGTPSQSPVSPAAEELTFPLTTGDSKTSGMKPAGISRADRISSDQHLFFTSKSVVPEASETSVARAPVRRNRI